MNQGSSKRCTTNADESPAHENVRRFPLKPSEVTNRFLSTCFGARVILFKIETSEKSPSNTFRVHSIKYCTKSDAFDLVNPPTSCIIKCCDTDMLRQDKQVELFKNFSCRAKSNPGAPASICAFKDRTSTTLSPGFCYVFEDLQTEQWWDLGDFSLNTVGENEFSGTNSGSAVATPVCVNAPAVVPFDAAAVTVTRTIKV
jgi:hypothetical protein